MDMENGGASHVHAALAFQVFHPFTESLVSILPGWSSSRSHLLHLTCLNSRLESVSCTHFACQLELGSPPFFFPPSSSNSIA